MKNLHFFLCILMLVGISMVYSCKQTPVEGNPEPIDSQNDNSMSVSFFRGADLSYVNEMRDCGAIYLNEAGEENNPYEIFSESGANLVRVRLWHTPDWTTYSNFEDVVRTIRASKEKGMPVLLDFHYSDTWADPGHQEVPAAWLAVVDDVQLLGDSVYAYTYRTLANLNALGLLPEMVQVGNEINSEILQDPDQAYDRINWTRNATLLNQGLQAVRDAAEAFGKPIQSMIHVAQPENALWWFAEASQHNLTQFDWIGISYYPKWSLFSFAQLAESITDLKETYGKRVMIVETAYPFTLDYQDEAHNLLGQDGLLEAFPATQAGQLGYLQALADAIEQGGGEGLIYWEPAWVSTPCSTLWGQGSHWENAALFDFSGHPTEAMGWFGENKP